LVGRSVGWLVGCLVGRLVGRFVGWPVDHSVVRSVCLYVGLLVEHWPHSSFDNDIGFLFVSLSYRDAGLLKAAVC
jgi:putative effector of murein hydrolase LrgA (UPF0299 family)